MAKQKPPDPIGSTSGFPYHLLWEEFGPEWVRLGDNPTAEEEFEALSKWLSQRGQTPPDVSREAIEDCLAAYRLEPAEHDALADRLYNLAATYLIPGIRKQCGFTPKAFQAELRKLARQAKNFLETYSGLHPLTNVALWNHDKSRTLDDDEWSSRFERTKTLINDLAKATTLFVNEMPKLERGTSVNILRQRFVSSAASLIAEANIGPITMLQSDSAGRNFRPDSEAARLLFKYLVLVDPSMSARTVYRILKECNALTPRRCRRS